MAFVKTSEKSNEPVAAGKTVETQVEGETREFVRRDVAPQRRQPEHDSEMVTSNIGNLLQRVAGTSVKEIDKLVRASSGAQGAETLFGSAATKSKIEDVLRSLSSRARPAASFSSTSPARST